MKTTDFIYDISKDDLIALFPREMQDYLTIENIVNACEYKDEGFSVYCEELDSKIHSEDIRSILETYAEEWL